MVSVGCWRCIIDFGGDPVRSLEALPILDGVLGLELAWSLALWAIICYL